MHCWVVLPAHALHHRRHRPDVFLWFSAARGSALASRTMRTATSARPVSPGRPSAKVVRRVLGHRKQLGRGSVVRRPLAGNLADAEESGRRPTSAERGASSAPDEGSTFNMNDTMLSSTGSRVLDREIFVDRLRGGLRRSSPTRKLRRSSGRGTRRCSAFLLRRHFGPQGGTLEASTWSRASQTCPRRGTRWTRTSRRRAPLAQMSRPLCVCLLAVLHPHRRPRRLRGPRDAAAGLRLHRPRPHHHGDFQPVWSREERPRRRAHLRGRRRDAGFRCARALRAQPGWAGVAGRRWRAQSGVAQAGEQPLLHSV